MELTILGSGTAIIKKTRTSASFLLKTNNNETILLDAGWGCPMRILESGANPQGLDHILITHPHPDHIGSLMNLLQSMLVSGYDVSGDGWQQRKREKPLHIHGYPGFTGDYETLRKIMFPERNEPYEIKIFEYPDNKRVFGDITIIGTEVVHVPQYFKASAFRVDADGKSVVYSGDCGFDERLIKLSKDADIALYEMSVPSWMFAKGARPNHISAIECGIIAAKAGVKRLVLVHLYDNDKEDTIISDVKKNFSGELIISHDLKKIKV